MNYVQDIFISVSGQLASSVTFNIGYILEFSLTVSPLDYCLSLHCDYNQGRRPPVYHFFIEKGKLNFLPQVQWRAM